MSGVVYLVGAGPGDPKLLTLRGRELLERADAVFYDALASPGLLKWARSDAELVYVGKRGGSHSISQAELNDRLVRAAKDGKTVVRLKGGDPFIFGRGGEEAEVLRDIGISVEIVPGIPSPIAAPTYAGIPLTHRRHASSVAFVTGHEDADKTESTVKWRKLGAAVDTIAILMGMRNLPNIAAQLLEGGRDANTPVAVIQWGARPTQKTVVGTLATIAEDVEREGVGSPSIILVGDVALLRERLRWHDAKPLFGRRIVVTRARAQASSLVERLAEAGADVIECPMIRVAPPDDFAALDAAIAELGAFDWVVFTSANAVAFFWERLDNANRDARAFASAHVAAIGPATERALRERGVRPDLIPTQSRSESVVEEIGDVSGMNIMLPRAAEGRETLRDGLIVAGANVADTVAYRTVPDAQDAARVLERLRDGEIDAVTFTSGSTVKNFLAALNDDNATELVSRTCVAVIGPVTAGVAREHGLKVAIQSQEASVESLAKALIDHFSALER